MKKVISNKKYLYSIIIFIVILFLMLSAFLIFKFINNIYYSVAYTKISSELVINSNAKNNTEKVAALFDYVNFQIKKEMMPGMYLPSFKYLEYGYAFCDQQSDVLSKLLYFQNIDSRLVPLFSANGISPHTFMEWDNGSEWLILDPLHGYNLPVSGKQLISLSKEKLLNDYGLSEEAYDFYEKNLFSELKNTYQNDDYTYWGPTKENRNIISKAFDIFIASTIVKLSDKKIPKLIQDAYIFKNYRDNTPENSYLIARNKRLFGDNSYAFSEYNKLLNDYQISDDWPDFAEYSVNDEMLKQRIKMIQNDY